ncbi:MAG: prepilin-type N-terminal cleavage/methylation domain-containing protein [Candidatus Gracilibacteria bacterium]|nr:prepilin-type N-terminal cleavage/methylation domain-containing protein [Candidatus Gracilibacteria bacterium]
MRKKIIVNSINLRPVPRLKKLTSGTSTEYKKQAFTLVELIVVITILAILATVGFVSFSGYLAGTRDVNRVSQLKSMSDALELYTTKKSLPIPDNKVDIKSGTNLIAYQGYIGKNVLETIEYTESGLDPKR